MSTILVQRKFSIYSSFLDVTLQLEDEIAAGETHQQALLRLHKELEETAAELRRMAGKTEGGGIPLPADYVEVKEVGIINLKDVRLQEEIEDRILAAGSVDELQAIKAKYVVLPAKLISTYNSRIKELSNEKV